MTEEYTKEEMNKVLFVNLVMMFSATAMQQLGKLMNPATKKVELDLAGAQTSIDLLTMLSEKTKGNLDKEEERLLKDTLSALQMNYVETAESAPAKAEPDAGKDLSGKPDVAESAVVGDNDQAKSAGVKTDARTKYHKSYGEQ